jgi:hypothetical protein
VGGFAERICTGASQEGSSRTSYKGEKRSSFLRNSLQITISIGLPTFCPRVT